MKYVLFVFLAVFSLKIAAQTPVNVDKIVAKIDNYYILKSEVETLVQRSKESGQEMDKCQAYESLVIQKLLVAKAELDSVIVEENQISSQLDARMAEMSRIYGNEKNIVQQFGKSLETLKSELKNQVKEQMTAEKMRNTITEKVEVTPNEVAQFFNKIPVDSLPYFPTEVTLSHLVKLATVTKEQKDEIISKLNGLKKRIELGESFADLAKEYSEDPGSKVQGGDLGFAKRGMMVAEFEAAAMSLDSGKLSNIVESEFGFHLIETLEIRGQEYRARHILINPDYSKLDLTKPKEYLDSLKLLLEKDSLKYNTAVKLYSEDKQSNEAGGVIFDPETGSTSMALDQSMEPNLYFAVNNLKVNEISKPLNHRTQSGKTGMRLVKVIAFKDSHRASLKDDYEKLKNFALNQKQSIIIDKWFKSALSEVYIKVDSEYESCNIFQQ